ncbi:alpha/beta fold hydrolase [Phaeobacter sp. C3_T13_0]|uniref:alpha/beta fold hydrolase n=1 Tax=Phaeobacter cretensis TaxID=3342641 RepID=UPI0039BC5367
MGDPLVLLPGMMCDARLFAPQLAAFSHKRMVAVAPLRDGNTMEALARSVLDQAPTRFALAGLSMGGIVAMEMIRQEPERITRLALLDTNALPDPPQNGSMRDAQVAKALSGNLKAVMRDQLKPNYLANGPHRDDILDLCMDMAETLGPDVFADQSHAIQHRLDQRETLKSVGIPTLLICGAEDRLCPLERHQLMHDLIAGSHLAVITGAGHLPTLEQPELTNRTLNAWLTQ